MPWHFAIDISPKHLLINKSYNDIDIDECSEESTNVCSLDEICSNTPGSYNCRCNPFIGWIPCTGIYTVKNLKPSREKHELQ
jgi:hypothetical protein